MSALAAQAAAVSPSALLVKVSLVLALALVLGHACRRYLGAPVVGELVTGVLLAPSVLGWLPDGALQWLSPANDATFDAVSQLAVVLVVGMAGVELDLGMLRRDRRAVTAMASGALVVPAMLGVVAALLLPASMQGNAGGRGHFVALVTVAIALSALPVAAVTLRQVGLLNLRIGQLILASATVIDLVAWLVLSVVTANPGGDGVRSVVVPVLGVVALLLISTVPLQPVLDRGLRAVTEWGDGPALVAGVATIFATAALGAATGLESVVGAMAGGVLAGRCQPLRAASARTLDHVATWVCAPLFLASAGAHLDISAFTDPHVVVIGCALLLVATIGKVVGGYLGSRVGGLSPRLSLAAGAALNSRGLVEIVMASIGVRIGLFSADMYAIVVGVALVTSLCAPVALRAILSRGTQEERVHVLAR